MTAPTTLPRGLLRAALWHRCRHGQRIPGYSHAICHQHGEFDVSSGKQGERDNIGGWHDAGDYGRYVVNSGISTGALMWAWEMNGDKIRKISLKIPESGNGTPDLLNEVRWNLHMDVEDAGRRRRSWHKQTSKEFPGFVMPQDDKLPSDVIGTG